MTHYPETLFIGPQILTFYFFKQV